MSTVNGAQLAQLRPSGTTTTTLFSASLRTEVTCIFIANTTTNTCAMSLYHDDDGSTFDETTALYFSKSVAANDTVKIEANSPGSGITVRAGGKIGVKSGVANALTFSLYGITEQR